MGNIWREKENRTLVSPIESKERRKEMDEGLTRDKIPIYLCILGAQRRRGLARIPAGQRRLLI